MQTIYYKMAELCLVQRACILRFSEEVARISAMNENKKNSLTARVSNLYKQYIRFVNRVYFREITAQEQGIELYSMLQEHMKIEQNVKDLDNEISELHQYAILREDQERNKNLTLLSILGAVFIIPTFISGFYGMNLFPAEDIKEYKILIWIMFGIGIVCTPASFIWFLSTLCKKPNYLILLLSLLILFTTLISPIILKL
jgi:Mg2+ and Co2+ transporter CorA